MSYAQKVLHDVSPYLKLSRLKSCLRDTINPYQTVVLVFPDNSKLCYKRSSNWRNDSLTVISHG